MLMNQNQEHIKSYPSWSIMFTSSQIHVQIHIYKNIIIIHHINWLKDSIHMAISLGAKKSIWQITKSIYDKVSGKIWDIGGVSPHNKSSV